MDQYGELLDYDGSPFLQLPDYTNQPVEWHFDGISSVRAERVPDWIFFLHYGSYSPTASLVKGFDVANCALIFDQLQSIIPNSFDLSNIHEVICNHRVGSSSVESTDTSDLLIQLVQFVCDEIPVIRAHIPFTHTYSINHVQNTIHCYPDNLDILFQPLNLSEQLQFLSQLQSILANPLCIFNHFFKQTSLLCIHNKSCFHSTQGLPSGTRKRVERLQLISS